MRAPGGRFIGRRAQFARIDGLLASPARSAVIAGTAGAGKTRLARELADEWRDRDGAVEWISGTASGSGIPFGAVARLLPSTPPAVAPGASADPMSQAAAVLREILGTLQAGANPLVVVDDVQLLDDPSAALVQHLALDGSVASILVVRNGEPVPAAIEMLWRDGHVERVELDPLDEAESAELAAELLGGDRVVPDTARALHAAGQGNPLLLRELIEDARAAGALVPSLDGWVWDGRLGRASHLQDAVGARLDALGPAGRRMLTLLALGEPLRFEVLSGLCPDVDLDEAARRELIRLDHRVDCAEVRLGHPLFGEVLRARERPDVLHERRLELAAVLEAASGDTEVELIRVAMLRLDAGDTTAHALYEEAGNRALTLGDSATARRFAETAVVHGGSVEALTLLGEAQLSMLDLDAALVTLEQAAEEADGADGGAQLFRIAFSLHQAHLHKGDPVPADTLLARFGPRMTDPVWRAILDGQLAQDLVLRGHTKAGGQRAERLLREWGHEPRVRLRLLTSIAPARALAGRTASALALAQQCFPDAMALRHELPLAPAWVVGAHLQSVLLAGRLEDAAQFIALIQALPGVPRVGGPFVDLYIGRLALLTGDVHRAAAVLAEAAASFDRADLGGFLRWCRSLEAEAYALCGDLDRALDRMAQAEAAMLRTQTYEGDARRARAWVVACAGRVDEAIASLIDLAGEQLREGQNLLAMVNMHDAVRLGATLDDVPGLAAIVPVVDGLWSAAISLHLAALATGAPADYELAARAFEDMGARLHAAELWPAAGDPARAQAILKACGDPDLPRG